MCLDQNLIFVDREEGGEGEGEGWWLSGGGGGGGGGWGLSGGPKFRLFEVFAYVINE